MDQPKPESEAKQESQPNFHPIRDLDQVRAELEEKKVEPMEIRLDEDFVPIANYKKANMGQVIKDWTRELKVQMHINGEPLAVILQKIQIETLRNSLKDFLNDENNKAENEKAVEMIFPKYLANRNLDDLSDNVLAHFINTFPGVESNLKLMIGNSPAGQDLMKILDVDIVRFFGEEAKDEANEKVWKNIVYNYLLNNEPPERQEEFVKFLIGYAHQGGFLFPAITTLTQIITDANNYSRTNFQASNDALHSSATVELNMVNGELVIREKTAVDRVFHNNEDFDEINDFTMEDHNEANKSYNVIEFDITQVARMDPVKMEQDESDIKVGIEIKDAKASVYDQQAWAFVLEEQKKSQHAAAMMPMLIEYANIYKLKRHDSAKAAAIIKQFPGILEIPAIKVLTNSDKVFFAHRVVHNEADSLLALLGRLNPGYANNITQHFADHLAQGQVAFTNAMKLVHRLGENATLVRLLAPYTQGLQVDFTKEIRPATYQAIVKQYAESKINDFEKNGKDQASFVQALQIYARNNEAAYLKLVQPLAPDIYKKELITKEGMVKLYEIQSAKLYETKLQPAHAMIADFHRTPPTEQEFIQTMEALQKFSPKELVSLLAPYKLIESKRADARVSRVDLKKAFDGFMKLSFPPDEPAQTPPPIPPRPNFHN